MFLRALQKDVYNLKIKKTRGRFDSFIPVCNVLKLNLLFEQIKCGIEQSILHWPQQVRALDRRVGGCGFYSQGWTNTQGLKITEK